MLDKQAHKLTWANRVSIFLLVVLVTVTFAVFAVRYVQNNVLNQTNEALSAAESKVTSLKDREGYAVLLKKRLDSIDKLSSDNKKIDSFSTVLALTPPDVQLSLISVEKTGEVHLTSSSPNVKSLDSYLAILQDKTRNNDSIQKIDMQNLSRNKDGLYRYDLVVTPK